MPVLTSIADLAPYGAPTGDTLRAAFTPGADTADLLRMVREILASGNDADVCAGEVPHLERWIIYVRATAGPTPPERHRDWHDCSAYLRGGNTIAVDGTMDGATETADGEWRGGALKGATNITVEAGGLLWVPAGIPHQNAFAPSTAFVIVKIHRDAEVNLAALDHISDQSHPQHVPSFAAGLKEAKASNYKLDLSRSSSSTLKT